MQLTRAVSTEVLLCLAQQGHGFARDEIAAVPTERLVDSLYEKRRAELEQARHFARLRCVLDTLTFGVPATLLGASGGWAGGLLGLFVGAAVAVERFISHERATAAVTLDGVTRKARAYGTDNAYLPTREELRAELDAGGITSEHIGPPAGTAPGPTRELPEAQAAALRSLAEQHRLVADLAQRSHHGHPILNVVTAAHAARLLEDGGKLYVVDAEPHTDRPRSLVVNIVNGRGDRAQDTEHHWVERSVSYALRPVTAAAELTTAPASAGLPDGILGVYRDVGSITLPVYERRDAAYLRLGSNERVETYSAREVQHVSDVERSSSAVGRDVFTILDMRRPAALLASIPGLITGLELFGKGNPAILVTAAAFCWAGVQAGKWLNDRQVQSPPRGP